MINSFRTGIQEHSIPNATKLTVSPNPVKNVATLKYSLLNNSSVQIKVYSIDGKLVINSGSIRQTAGFNTFSLNIAEHNLNAGAYICKVLVNGGASNVLTSKILVQK